MSTGREIHLVENDDGTWTARDLDAELTAMGSSRDEALENLDDVIAAASGNGGHEPSDDELRALGIDPEKNQSRKESPQDLPGVLK